MSAFNHRFKPTEFFGLPANGCMAIVLALAGVLFMILPTPLVVRVFSGLVSLAAIYVATLIFSLGDDLPFYGTRTVARAMRRATALELRDR